MVLVINPFQRPVTRRVLFWRSTICIALSFTVKFLIYLELYFLYGERYSFNFLLLHMINQFSHYHLLDREFFLVYFCWLCQKKVGCRNVNLFQGFLFFLLVYMCIFVATHVIWITVACSTSQVMWGLQDCFVVNVALAKWAVLFFHMTFRIVF